MSKQNIVYLGRDNPIIIDFTFTGDFETDGLSNFTDIQVFIGDETYTLLINPSNVIVSSNTQLRILIGDTTSLPSGNYEIKILGISGVYDDGYVLAGCGSIERVSVKEF
ncbi:MAG: hypothetical protein ACN2B6_01305 [Rickettsiales bacterium]